QGQYPGEVGVTPSGRRLGEVVAQQHQAALADGDAAPAGHLHAADVAAAEGVDVGQDDLALAELGQAVPAPCQGAVGTVGEVGPQPGGAARTGDGLPRAAAVGGAVQAGGVLVAAVAGRVAGLAVLEEPDPVQTGQGVDGTFTPGEAAVGGEEEDAGAAA